MRSGFKWQRNTALFAATGITAYMVLSEFVLQPLHEAGVAQGLLGYLNGLAAALQFPGFAVVQKLGLRPFGHTPRHIWALLVAINFPMWAVGLRVVLGILFPRRHTPQAQPSPQLTPSPDTPGKGRGEGFSSDMQRSQPAITRRDILVGGARLAAVGVTGAAGYGFLIAPRRFEITRRTYPLRDLRPELTGLRIVQITDIHHGPTLSLDYVREIVAAANDLKPDLTLLTGDYVYRSPKYIEPVIRELAGLKASVGVVGVLGNHDWWEDADLCKLHFARVGIPLVDNRRLFVTPDRKIVEHCDEGLCIAGVGDLYEDLMLFEQALGGINENVPRLLLSHNPDAAEDTRLLRSRLRCDLMLSGHTHGGQVWVPGLGAVILPSRFGQKYVSGLVKGPACDVYVSKGLGTTLLPMRLGAQPEIALIEFQSA